VVLTGRRELRVFKMLARYIKDSSIAGNFLDILLPLLRKKDISSGMTSLQDLLIKIFCIIMLPPVIPVCTIENILHCHAVAC
jgi:hypothetical protein